eukprot:scaffold315658_cov13-Tisochrysis_lutea.AAC.1
MSKPWLQHTCEASARHPSCHHSMPTKCQQDILDITTAHLPLSPSAAASTSSASSASSVSARPRFLPRDPALAPLLLLTPRTLAAGLRTDP